MDTQAGDISNQAEDRYNKSLAAAGPAAKGDLGEDAGKEFDKKLGAAVSGMHSRLESGRAKLASAEGTLAGGGAPPQMQLVPPPQPQQTSPEQIWGSLAMILAGVGSLASRQHMTTALNAAAGVMNAFHKNDLENYQASYNTWKASNDNAIKIAQYENRTYQDTLRNILAENRINVAQGNLDVRETLAQLTALAHSYDDPLMKTRLANEGVKGAIAVTKERDRQLDRITKVGKDADKLAKEHYKGMTFKDAWASYSNSAEGQLLKQQNPNAFAQKFFQMQRQIAPHTDTRGQGDPKDRAASDRAWKNKYGAQQWLGKKAITPDEFYRTEWKTYGDEPQPKGPIQGSAYFKAAGGDPEAARAKRDPSQEGREEGGLPRQDLFDDGARPHLPKGMSPEEARKKFGKGTPVILPDGTEGVVP